MATAGGKSHALDSVDWWGSGAKYYYNWKAIRALEEDQTWKVAVVGEDEVAQWNLGLIRPWLLE